MIKGLRCRVTGGASFGITIPKTYITSDKIKVGEIYDIDLVPHKSGDIPNADQE